MPPYEAARTIPRMMRAMLPERMLTILVARRARRHSHRLNRGWGVAQLSETLFDRLGPRVLSGPFEGLILPRGASAEHVGPYLLGTYERELHGFWHTLPSGSVPLIVNVGAKFGYYSVGLARRLGAPAIAYDADKWARALLAETAALNAAAVEIRGQCSRRDLEDLPRGTLVVIDCDGCEEALLAEPLPRALRHCLLVIEVHDAVMDGDTLTERLGRTHSMESIASLDASEPPAVLAFLDAELRKLAVEEIRSPQRWLLCRPRS